MSRGITENEKVVDLALRPKKWEEYIGQAKLKRNLNIIIEAAKKRREVCDHLLFYGQAGLGKTTLAYLIATEMQTEIKTTTGPAIEKISDLASILTNLKENDILFIDEAHRLNKLVEEILYPAMENRILNIIVGKGPSARTFQIDLPPFTLVAATTRPGMLSNPLRSRFGATFKLDFYENKDIEQIIERSAKLLNVDISQDAVKFLAKISRGTPRVANRLLKRARDYAQVKDKPRLDLSAAQEAMNLLEIDELGLETTDKKILNTIVEKFDGGPVGLGSLAAAINEERDNIEEICEPYLLRVGFLARTPKGRIVTPAGYKYLNIPLKKQEELNI